jgi:hypothetical protein
MCCLLEARRVNEIPVDFMQWSLSFLGLGWYASVFFYAKPDLFIVCRKIEPQLVKGDHKLPILVFDAPQLAQQLK